MVVVGGSVAADCMRLVDVNIFNPPAGEEMGRIILGCCLASMPLQIV